jgi:hypothetical protein
MNRKYILRNILIAFSFICLTAGAAFTQTTEFTYQGKLTDSGIPQATYLMQFKLFDAVSNGAQIGATLTNSAVAVNSGGFTVSLDFGAAAFDGSDRFLEIAVKKNAGEQFTVLTPRQKLTSAPYSIMASNSAKLGGAAANTYLQTDGDGAGLTNLNAAQIASGTLNDARLSPNVAKLAADNIFTGNGNSFAQITLSGDGQIVGSRLENSPKDPAPASAANAGRIYFNTTTNNLKVSGGSTWVDLLPTAPRPLQTFYANTATGAITCGSNIRSISFTKNSAATRLRITYRDSPYATTFSASAPIDVIVKIDGANVSPVSLTNNFTPTAVGGGSPPQGGQDIMTVGYAEGISAGTHTMTTNYGTFAGGGSPSSCYRPAKYLIEIEELP